MFISRQTRTSGARSDKDRRQDSHGKAPRQALRSNKRQGGRWSCGNVSQIGPGRAGAGRGLIIDEVAALGVMGTRRRGGEPLSLGSSQPKPRAWRRKHIADGPEGAASRARARQRLTLQGFARCRAGRAHFSTTNGSNFNKWGAASPQIFLAGIIRVHWGYSWFKEIWAWRAQQA